ncbi:MAG: hypothetical protein GY756_03605 [bacterium]|nr:hypothetical protein [bacterium]
MRISTQLKSLFWRSIQRGTGEAIHIIKAHPEIDFSEYIIKASVKNLAYDGQCESSRAQYLYEIFNLSMNQEKIKSAIFTALLNEKKDTWALTQLFDFAKLFALQGDVKARDLMYQRFFQNTIEGSNWVGGYEIIDLDGIEGMLYIAQTIGASILKNSEIIEDNMMINYFKDQNPKINAEEILKEKGKRDIAIKSYLNNISRTEKKRANRSEKSKKYADIIDEIENCRSIFSLRKRKFSMEELESIAIQMQQAKTSTLLERYLQLFSRNPFPFDVSYLLDVAEKRCKKSIDPFVIGALSQNSDERIRHYALEKLNKTSRPEYYLELLVNNYRESDSDLLQDIVEKTRYEHRIEHLAYTITDIYKKNKTTGCKGPLEALYNKMNCGIHRNTVIELLIEMSQLSDKISKEAIYDCDFETRELVKRNIAQGIINHENCERINKAII